MSKLTDMSQSLAARLEPWRGAALIAILSPLIVSLTPMAPRWDDTYFLHRAVCLARSVWSADLPQADGCLQAVTKSPLMALLLIPGGPPHGILKV